jgi:hypothetical protein
VSVEVYQQVLGGLVGCSEMGGIRYSRATPALSICSASMYSASSPVVFSIDLAQD